MNEPLIISRAYGAALYGIEAVRVEVQAARAWGIPREAIIGQAEAVVREGRDRIKVALQSAGLWENAAEQPIIVNLAPAGVRKAGTGLDLPIALAIAALSVRSLGEALEGVLAFGEVGLDGTLRPSRGTLSAALAAREAGLARVLVPPDAAREAAEVHGLEVIAARHLADAVSALAGREDARAAWPPRTPPPRREPCDLSEVRGQQRARRALEVAAAGGHNLLMIGPPGSGKTLLARRLPTILPPLTRDEALEVTRVHSAAGLLGAGGGLVVERPFRAPHHSVTPAGMIGGGAPPAPGEVSLAAHGVLFLDELPEFPRGVLETLRQPLEDGTITIARALGRATFPARMLLVAAMNPCPCGWRGSKRRACRCSPSVVARYRARLSGPLLDRLDLHVEVPAVDASDIARSAEGEASGGVRERVLGARRRQLERQARLREKRGDEDCEGAPRWNANLRPRELGAACSMSEAARDALEAAMSRLGLSARAHDRVLKVARTIADLAGSERVEVAHVGEAVAYRTLDRAPG